MIKVLVTGCNGQLGQSIKAISENFPSINFEFVNTTQLDITSETQINQLFKNKKFDFVINCAAYTAVDLAEENHDLAFLVNADGAKYLATACSKNNTVLIHISTDFVFDGNKKTPYIETDQPNPINIYGKSKLLGEAYIQKFCPNHFIIRTSWLYSEFGNNFLKTILKLTKVKNEISVVNDQIGSPTYTGDLARFIIFLVLKNSHNYGIYNYSNIGEVSWYGFALSIIKLGNLNISVVPILSKNYDTKAKRPNYSVLNKEKAIHTFQIKVPHWETSLVLALNSYGQSAHD